MAKRNATATAPPTTIEAVKGFDRNFRCRGFQFAIGETYKVRGAVEICRNGFHACEHPLHVWDYYPLNESRFALVDLGGAMDRSGDGDTKIAAAEITIKAELKLPDVIKRGVEWILRHAKDNTATGDRGHAAATGKWGIAAALGPNSTAKAGETGWITLSAWRWTGSEYELLHVRSARVGGPEGIKPDINYRLSGAGEFEECAA